MADSSDFKVIEPKVTLEDLLSQKDFKPIFVGDPPPGHWGHGIPYSQLPYWAERVEDE